MRLRPRSTRHARHGARALDAVLADTNVVMSAFLWGGPPADVLNAARRQTITLYCSAPLIAELEDVLSRDKFAARLKQVGSSATEMWATIGRCCNGSLPLSAARGAQRSRR